MKKLKDLIIEEVSNICSELFFESHRGFSFKVLKKLKTKKEVYKYAKKHLIKLGEGSSRAVFALGAGKVLKIQRSKHFFQNKQEVDVYTNSKIPKKYLAKIYDFADDYSWIISEAVQVFRDNKHAQARLTIDETTFSYFLGASYNKDFNTALSIGIDRRNRDNKNDLYKGETKNIYEKDLNNLDMQLLHVAYNLEKLGIDDIDRLDHWGVTSSGNIVLVDYGFYV